MKASTPISWLLFGSALVSAQLLVAKNYATSHIVAGEPIEVMYEFYNQGDEYASTLVVIREKTHPVPSHFYPLIGR